MRDLMQLLREDTATQARVASYGIDPTRVEEWLEERAWHITDPTADLAIANADRELARRKRR